MRWFGLAKLRRTADRPVLDSTVPEGVSRRLSLEWSDEARADMAVLEEYMPTAVAKGKAGIRRLARSGFNYGRRTISDPDLWYWPDMKVGVFYIATATALRVVRVVDARHLRNLP